jgi:HNH endonuclease
MVAFHRLEQAVVSGRASGRSEAASLQPEPTGSVRHAPAPAPTPGAKATDADAPVSTDTCAVPPSEPAPEPRRSWRVMLTSLAHWLDGTLQTSAAGAEAAAMKAEPISARSRVGASAGRVTLRLRMPRSTYVWWRLLEARAQRWLGRGISWLRFLCSSMWQAWRHLLHADVAYGRVYIRDRYRCTSPVCTRQDVTPHHLRFRSAGGSDDDDNVASVCTWCHLLGVHGGRIRAEGPAGHIHWELGAPGSPCLVVDGRDRL